MHKMNSEVFKMHDKTIWINKDIPYRFNTNIVEYDMKAASVSVCEHDHLLDDTLIQQLKLMPKEQRTRKMGLLQREDKVFSEKLLSGIKNIRRKFIETNSITEEMILSIHSDAIFFETHDNIICDIEGVEFRKKNSWSSYILYDGIEILYENDYITYKNTSQDHINQHTLGLTKMLRRYFEYMENCDEEIFNYLKKFQGMYLSDRLPYQYYISFGKIGDIKVSNLQLLSYLTKISLQEVRRWNYVSISGKTKSP